MASTRKPRSSRRRQMVARVARPPVLVGGGFALLAAGIVANALFLQSTRHPAPFFATREIESARPPASDPLVRSLQSSLSDAGYYVGPIDGFAGPQTTSAIGAFEKSAGRLVTGRPDPQLLAVIQARQLAALAPPHAARPPAPLQATLPARQAPAEIRSADPKILAVQEALAKAAYGPLLADGLLGQQTRDAIERFQRDRDLPVTGEINDALILELRAAGALAGD